MSLRMKLLSLIGFCAIAFIGFSLVSLTTLNKVKINGDEYNRIAQEKDLIADILPPPEYLVEAYLVIYQMVEETDDAKLKELIGKSKKLREEYDERHKYWADKLPDGSLKSELIATSYKPAINFFKIQDEQVIPAILKNNRDAARQIVRTSIKPLYEEHRLAIDQAVKMANDLLTNDEQNIKSVVNGRTSLLLILGLVIFITIFICGFYMNYVSVSIVGRIKQIGEGLSVGAQQIVSASSQISSASQSLAEGASEQAASLEETSSSMEEMSSMTKQNADNANQAKAMMGDAKNIVEKVSGHMDEMSKAILEITKSSEETSKIIKTIDEIAFQTNLLALNAAVEAARAGEAGAGFAVVADEVRNLAMRAAEAAKSTNNLIENTIKAVKNGNELTKKTQEAFKENITISGKIGQLIDEIATASIEQAHGISQVGIAINEMNGVTQQTAATAEESASASEELNAQAEQMKSYVAELSAVVGGSSTAEPIFQSGRTAHKQTPDVTKQGKALKLIAAPVKQEKVTFTRAKAVNPEKVIPMKEGKFKDI